ncbi:MAG TPA: universal stress protein [Polyangiaceae bacterium]
MFRRILVPVDYSENSRQSLIFAAKLAAGVGAALDVVHVWDRPAYVSDAVMVRRPGQEHCSLAELIEDNAQRDMKEFLATVAFPAGLTVEGRLCSGDPVSTLIAEAKSKQHDLVVIGTHGRTGLAHMLLGSVTEKLIRLSPVPVLTLPPART